MSECLTCKGSGCRPDALDTERPVRDCSCPDCDGRGYSLDDDMDDESW